jgi:hypothetical protein
MEPTMAAIGTSTTGRRAAGRWVTAAVSVLLLMLSATGVPAQEGAEPVQPPEPVEAVGELSCAPRTPVAGDTLTCTATGAEGFAELDVALLLYSRATGPDEEGVLWPQEDVVPVEDGVATFAFVIVDQAVEGDEWEAYAWMIGGSRQDCFVIERETGQVVATGALDAMDDTTFVVGGETYGADLFSLVCTDELRFDAADGGPIGASPAHGEDPAPPDEQPGPPAAEPVGGTESSLPPTGAAPLLLLLTGALAVGGGLAIWRR